ncbi:copper resistance CopC family protein [Lacisediminihabitans profunda]|uniref:Copper resistance protein CopC n=1 Tax=Lacisediminihabitans profunda TaxID=2594790 RepID=A0A5C8UTY5_9MICO|nr:copper resistance CopC family protein [Lacisediminihabitans profunda]TXN31400.1 copper resistance protein CopC [Lacisediminihabitans profunda]
MAGFGTLVAVGAVLGIAAPAQAHNYPIATTPTANETLTELPPKFSVTTNGTLLDIEGNDAGFALQVRDSAGRYYGDGCVSVDGPTLATDAALGAAGRYTITWQAISTDAHTVSDSFEFTWQPPAGFTPSPGSAKVPDCHGKLKPNGTGAPIGASRAASVDEGTLQAVLWIGGAVLAVGAAVIVTVLATSRRKPGPKA